MFFDALGKPWPEHRCAEADATPEAHGWIEVAITSTDPKLQQWRDRIDEQVAQRAAQCKSRTRDPIVSVAPRRGAAREVVGSLRELQVDVSIYETLGLQGNAMTRALLGPLGIGPLAKLTVHVPACEEDEIESYTVWVPRATVTARSAKGQPVALTIELRKAKSDHVWWSDSLEFLQPHLRTTSSGRERSKPNTFHTGGDA